MACDGDVILCVFVMSLYVKCVAAYSIYVLRALENNNHNQHTYKHSKNTSNYESPSPTDDTVPPK